MAQIVNIKQSQTEVGQPAKDDSLNPQLAKTRMCRFFPRCSKGDSCPFAHAHQDLRPCPDLMKSKICAGWRDGRCKLSAKKCKFAHGPDDLRVEEPISSSASSTSSTKATSSEEKVPTGDEGRQLSVSSASRRVPMTVAMVQSHLQQPQQRQRQNRQQFQQLPQQPQQRPQQRLRQHLQQLQLQHRPQQQQQQQQQHQQQLLAQTPGSESEGGCTTPQQQHDQQQQLLAQRPGPESEGLGLLVSSWLQEIQATLGTQGHDHGTKLPSPEECALALLKWTPDHYED
mmetsp:Transcript_51606/g.167628  ORF Transcript_51606/g.167628 Transcript_51606/m.167628 type:complete len:285 (-) Transcript_51606:273-1127(-)